MKKNIQKIALSIIAVITCTSASAQLYKSYPKIGEITTNQYANTYEISEGNEGIGQFWDMTQLTDSIGKNYSSYIELKNSNYDTSFPNATHVCYSVNEGITDTTFLYYFLDSAEGFLYYLGNASKQTVDVFSNASKNIKYPTNFGDTFSDYYESLINNQRINSFTKADAKGSMKLPWGTYGVIRIKLTINLIIEIDGKDYIGIVDFYSFIDTLDSKEILSITYTSGDFNKTKIVTYNLDKKIKANIESQKALKNILIYPNPVKNFINIPKNENIQNLEYKITDLQGKIIKNGIIDNNHQIDVNELINGFYFLYIYNKSDQNYFVQKFIKEN